MTTTMHQPAAEIPAGIHWTQAHGGECRWIERTRDDLLAVLQGDNAPEFRTVLGSIELDADGVPARAEGPFYVDFDGDLSDTLRDFRQFLERLAGHDLDLAQVRTFATGGRGFHAEIPQACFMPKTPANGTAGLHLIYREMAKALGDGLPTLDRRVYSIKRQWRTPNVQRPNSQFKVPLTASQVQHLTPDEYANLCSTPRPFPPLSLATFAPKLGAVFTGAMGKATTLQACRKRPDSKLAENLRSRFTGRGTPLPPSLLGIASGRIPPREGVGFNSLALQLCVTAIAMGLSESRLLDLCRGLIEHHKGDGARYDTPRKRERELRDMYRFAERSRYVPSVGGIRSILPAGLRCNDFRGL